MGDSRPVTIVVPIYGHLASLLNCIDSVLQHVDLETNRLLLVNDVGPDADEIEVAVLEAIRGRDGVRYSRNERNLGFVGCCNRAVLELDDSDNDVLLLNSDAVLSEGALEEMTAVLALDEKHGMVHPRSNNASIASVPIVPISEIGTDGELSRIVFPQLAIHLPRYTLTPVAVGFCFLVRRTLIRNYGLFDEMFSPGYSEENEFCLRVNRYGYSAVLANHVLVWHEGSKSFTDPEISEVQARNEAALMERYPFYYASVAHYLQFQIDPIDWFADRLFGGGRPRVLIDMFHMSLIYNGSTRNALSFLDLLHRRAPELDIEFVIVSSAEAIEFFDLNAYGFRVVANGELEETFDLGFALSPVSDQRQINVLNRHCVRWVVSHFDVIALRINTLLEVNYTRRQVVLDSLVHADRVIPISSAALDDIESYFGPASAGIRDHSTVIHEGANGSDLTAVGGQSGDWSEDVGKLVADGGYVLVVGNVFPHKQFPEALHAMAGFDDPVVGFGSLGGQPAPDGVVVIEGGHLSDGQVDDLYRNAGVVIFPSSYEGFGLPIVEAGRQDRSLIVFDMAVSREVVGSLGLEDLVCYFRELRELPDLARRALAQSRPSRPRPLRSLDLYNSGILDVILDVLATPVDLNRLRSRVAGFRRIEQYADSLERRLSGALGTAQAIQASRSYRVSRALAHRLGPLRPAVRLGFRALQRIRRR